MDKEGRSAAERHANTSPSKLGYAKWKDVLTGSWNDPDPMLAWVRGSVCMFPQNRAEPVWVTGVASATQNEIVTASAVKMKKLILLVMSMCLPLMGAEPRWGILSVFKLDCKFLMAR